MSELDKKKTKPNYFVSKRATAPTNSKGPYTTTYLTPPPPDFKRTILPYGQETQHNNNHSRGGNGHRETGAFILRTAVELPPHLGRYYPNLGAINLLGPGI